MFIINGLKQDLAMKKTAKILKIGSTVDTQDVARFNAVAGDWWDESGPLAPLHQLNPARLSYIRRQVCAHLDLPDQGLTPFQGLKIADVGCGGGIVAEPLARLGARVTGIDAAEEGIRAARAHARPQNLAIDYRVLTAEKLAQKQPGTFDVVTALEIVEHVAEPALFIAACCRLLKKDGVLILSTLNRTPKSWLLGILAAEYVLQWVPPGTHDWRQFLKPSELARLVEKGGARPVDLCGLVFDPLHRRFSLKPGDLGVNYLMTAVRC